MDIERTELEKIGIFIEGDEVRKKKEEENHWDTQPGRKMIVLFFKGQSHNGV